MEVVFVNSLSPNTCFGVVGGDLRQAALAKKLSEQGFCVKAFFLEHFPQFLSPELCCDDLTKLSDCDVVILPLPVSINEAFLNAPLSDQSVSLSVVLSFCKKDALIFGGKVSSGDLKKAEQLGLSISDYLKREEMAVLNAVPTAEGAVALALSERASTLWESNCLITGFGRCAKTLALLLKGFGAHVTIAARKEGDLAFARTLGLSSCHLSELPMVLPKQEILFNTIPHIIFDRDLLSMVPEDCLMIDLASRPGGIDFETASELGRKTIWALSLPGKVAPITAGNIICQTVINMIRSIA